MKPSLIPSCFSPTLCQLGENPVWNTSEDALYWVDVIGRTLYKRVPGASDETNWALPGLLGSMAFRRTGGLLMAFRNRIAITDTVGREFRDLNQTVIDFSVERINDGAVDSRGRFWFGTFSPRQEPGRGSLYRLDHDMSLHRMDSGITMSNGMAWSPDDRFMYYVDSYPGRIWRYPFDAGNGTVGPRELFVDYAGRKGVPDGCCVDTEGNLWVAEVKGGCVARYSPDPRPDRAPELTITMPLSKPTSVAFGGVGLATLFITTEWNGLSDGERKSEPLAGATFTVEGLAQGLAQPLYAG